MTKIFCDIADLDKIKEFNKKKIVKGFTTNPSLMRKAGAKNYISYSKKILSICQKKPVSLEVFADDLKNIKKQAFILNDLGKNVFVKIPVVNSKGIFLGKIIKELNKEKIKLNITAVYSVSQTKKILSCIENSTPVIISIFCGRIADSGIDPEPLIIKAKKIYKDYKNVKILWASVREVYNYYQAKRTKTDIITVPPNLIEKINSKKVSLLSYSKKTVKQFFEDGKKSKFKI